MSVEVTALREPQAALTAHELPSLVHRLDVIVKLVFCLTLMSAFRTKVLRRPSMLRFHVSRELRSSARIEGAERAGIAPGPVLFSPVSHLFSFSAESGPAL